MPRDTDRPRLLHMLEHAREAIDLVAGKPRQDLDAGMLSLAVVRLLEIIGEAAAGVSAESRGKLPAIPWAEIIDLRSRLLHGYDYVDLDIVWSIVHGDLPALVRELSADSDLQNDQLNESHGSCRGRAVDTQMNPDSVVEGTGLVSKQR